ncbi:MAG TPA: hypothetical protein VLG47_08195 [Candidatus Saccharimonadales bacterium]|nr:hypothetical protein [Candidatus Saccharimonadales bacterium]
MKSRPPRKQPSTKSPTSAKRKVNQDVKLAVGSVLTLVGGLGVYFTYVPIFWFAAIAFIAGLVILYFYMKEQGGL